MSDLKLTFLATLFLILSMLMVGAAMIDSDERGAEDAAWPLPTAQVQ